ncbi:MAG TPA: diadenylate cyclase CdaA [Bacillota bacterium]|nr:diadenylate cyclase CdaA [Bacillota bacterium]
MNLLESFFNLKMSGENPAVLIIDIIMTLLLIYQIFQVLKGTKAIPLLNGLIIIFIISVASEWLRLYIFAGFLKFILFVLLIALPVLFQPELRRALEQLGKRNILVRWLKLSPEPPMQTLHAVATAAERMAQEGVGGLIVLERETPLDEIVESGSLLDAAVTPIILQQIFAKHTPLHDGAVVIRGTRLLAAACVLPLSARKKLPVQWGTRHRAGLGLAENSDALIVIISEERKSITLAYDGDFKEAENAEALLALLSSITQTEVETKSQPSPEGGS